MANGPRHDKKQFSAVRRLQIFAIAIFSRSVAVSPVFCGNRGRIALNGGQEGKTDKYKREFDDGDKAIVEKPVCPGRFN
nr:hypothetical protein BaRGS_027256 [Batillaria attramentaria]